MNAPTPKPGPVLRIFEVTAKPGCVETLLEKFATTSAAVVADEPGNAGYFFGRCVQPATDADSMMFVSLWTDLDAVKARFGADWQESFLPEGYDDLIERHSLRHIDASGGWHIA